MTFTWACFEMFWINVCVSNPRLSQVFHLNHLISILQNRDTVFQSPGQPSKKLVWLLPCCKPRPGTYCSRSRWDGIQQCQDNGARFALLGWVDAAGAGRGSKTGQRVEAFGSDHCAGVLLEDSAEKVSAAWAKQGAHMCAYTCSSRADGFEVPWTLARWVYTAELGWFSSLAEKVLEELQSIASGPSGFWEVDGWALSLHPDQAARRWRNWPSENSCIPIFVGAGSSQRFEFKQQILLLELCFSRAIQRLPCWLWCWQCRAWWFGDAVERWVGVAFWYTLASGRRDVLPGLGGAGRRFACASKGDALHLDLYICVCAVPNL